MAESRSFQEKQYALAAHIRDPKHHPAPTGVEDRRIAIYRELFFNNLRSLLGTMFPVLRKLHDDAHWGRLIRSFMRGHQARTPYFLQLPQEFLSHLQNGYEPSDDDYPFLIELAHYEYVELALSISTDENDLSDVDPDGDLLDNAPVKSVLTWVFAYQYPVHRISPSFLPTEPLEQPVYIAVYRRPDDSVGFLELNPVSAGLLNAIDENSANQSGRELLMNIATQINYPDTKAFIAHGKAALEEMRQLDILTGTRRTEFQERAK